MGSATVFTLVLVLILIRVLPTWPEDVWGPYPSWAMTGILISATILIVLRITSTIAS